MRDETAWIDPFARECRQAIQESVPELKHPMPKLAHRQPRYLALGIVLLQYRCAGAVHRKIHVGSDQMTGDQGQQYREVHRRVWKHLPYLRPVE